MTRIAVVGYNPKKIGGIESFSRSISQVLPYTFHYIYEYNEEGPFYVSNTKAVLEHNLLNRIANKISSGFYSQNKIKKHLIKNKYDIIILNSPKYLDLVPDLGRVILVQHTTVENWWNSKFKFNRKKNLLELSKKVFKIISLSEYEKKELITRFNYPEQLIQTINMVNTLPVKNKPNPPSKKIIMLSRFQNEIKRIDLVINSMSLLPDFQLNIYGDGIDKDYLLQIAKPIPNVNVFESTNDKIKVLNENSIYVISSEFEGFPVSLIEAMSQGLTLIVRNSFLSAPCFIRNNGILLDKEWSGDAFKNAVLYCYENYQKMAEKSLDMALNYDGKKVGSSWYQLINELINHEK